MSLTCRAISPHLETSHLPVRPSDLTWRHLTYLSGHHTSPGDISPTCITTHLTRRHLTYLETYLETHHLPVLTSHHTWRHTTYLYGHLISPGDISPTCLAVTPHPETSHLPVWPSHITWRHLTYCMAISPHLRHLTYLYGHLTAPGDISPTSRAISPHLETSHVPVGQSHLTRRHLTYLYGHLITP